MGMSILLFYLLGILVKIVELSFQSYRPSFWNTMQRMGEQWDIAAGMVYQLSDASSFFTGNILDIDGGVSDRATIAVGIDILWDKKVPYVAAWTDANTDTMTYDLAGRRGYARLTCQWG